MTGTVKGSLKKPCRDLLLGAAGLCLVCVLTGCLHRDEAAPLAVSPASADTLALGVVHRALPTGLDAGVDLVDVDLARATARPAIVTGEIGQDGGPAYTPEEWLTRTHALAAVNGGYFGMEDGQGRKQFIGLLVRRGKVRQQAAPQTGHGSATLAPGRYVRSAFGLSRDGTPSIVWASTLPRLSSYTSPLIARQRPRLWPAWDAVGCGPTLIQEGKLVVTDRWERLASPGPLPRTFVAYGGPPGHPTHFILGVASAMTFQALAAWLQDYFPRHDRVPAQAAMCLDGGASTQLSYRFQNGVLSPRLTDVSVPDAVVILPH